MAKRSTTLNAYTTVVKNALKQLELAMIYADDGGHLDAARCANAAVTHLFEAFKLRNQYLKEVG
jgi:hypothetical protein